MSAHILINSFNGGEQSPQLEARTDINKHRSGCRKMWNFVPRTFGGAHSRPGMVFRGAAKSPLVGNKTRLLEFAFSETTSLIIEMGNQYLRFWRDGDLVHISDAPVWVLDAGLARKKGDFVKRSGVLFYALQDHNSISASEPQAGASWQDYWIQQDIYEVPAPWTTAQLFDVQYYQVNDVVRLVHPDVEPQKLSRLADDRWTLAPVDYTWPPFGDENVTDVTMTISHTSGTGRTLTASADTFLPGHVGGHFLIAHRRENSSVELNLFLSGHNESWVTGKAYVTGDTIHHRGQYWLCSNNHTAGAANEPGVGTGYLSFWNAQSGGTYTSASLRVVGQWQFFTYESWAGTIYIERSEDNGTTWEVLRSYTGNNDKNVESSGTQDNEALLRARFVDTVVDGVVTPDGRCVLEAIEPKVEGYVKVTAITSPTVATVDVIRSIYATTATKYWREGSWSDARGWPRTVTMFEQRIIYGGSRAFPRNIWGSAIGDFDHFRYTTLEDAGFSYLPNGRPNIIQWLIGKAALMVGTLGDELVSTGANQQTTISPNSVNIRPQSDFGSAHLPALLANDIVLFVEADRRTLREFVFSFDSDGFVAQRMTLLANHITRGGIVQMALAKKPEAIVWAVTGDGRLIGMTYERLQEVVAWHQHPTDGFVESVAVVPGTAPAADEVWIVVRRQADGNPVRYLERLDPLHWNKVEDGNQSYLICSDSARAQEFDPPVTTVPNLEHLEGREVVVLVDGAVHPKRTVTDGEIELQLPGSVVVVGLPFVATLEPNEIDLPLPDGSSRARKMRIDRVQLQMWQSLGCEVRHGQDTEWEEILFRDVDTPMDTPPELFTGAKQAYLEGRHVQSVQLQVRQTQPLPLNVLAITTMLSVYGD
ncbi:MAG TPA: hypothetical protein VGE29_08130 [Prosthecobacter sp.]